MVVSEADCFMLVKMFDSNGDGLLSLIDMMLILCPRNYTYRKNFRSTKQHFEYGVRQPNLSHLISFATMKVLEKEIEALKEGETLKQ